MQIWLKKQERKQIKTINEINVKHFPRYIARMWISNARDCLSNLFSCLGFFSYAGEWRLMRLDFWQMFCFWVGWILKIGGKYQAPPSRKSREKSIKKSHQNSHISHPRKRKKLVKIIHRKKYNNINLPYLFIYFEEKNCIKIH